MVVGVRRALVSIVAPCLILGGSVVGVPYASASPSSVTIISPDMGVDITNGETYHPNPLTIETVVEHVMGPEIGADGTELTHCARVERVVLSGLRDVKVASRLMDEARSAQNEFLAQVWEIDEVVEVDHCLPSTIDGHGQLTLTVHAAANFANLLSLDLGWEDLSTGSSGVISAVNARLDTGRILKLADFFARGTDLGHVISETAAGGLTEEAITELEGLYRGGQTSDFVFNETSVTLRPPRDDSILRPVSEFPIDYADQWSKLAIYHLAAEKDGLYLGSAEPVTCPALTRYEVATRDATAPWNKPYCWHPEPVEVGSVDLNHLGGEVTIRLDLAPTAQWEVVDHAEIISAGPTLTAGVGSEDINVTVASNDGAAPRTEAAIHMWVADPVTREAYAAVIGVRQAGSAAPQAPVVTAANATWVTGTVAKPFSAETRISLTWPNGETTGPVVVDTRGVWEVQTPTMMASGDIAVVAANPAGASPVTTARLDTGAPGAPVIVAADQSQVVGVVREPVDPGTTVLVTWPDKTQSVGTALRADSAFVVPTPTGMPSGPVMAWTTDQVGNLSPAVTAQLNVDPMGAPRIRVANATHVHGEVAPGVNVVTVGWPDGSTQAGVAVKDAVIDVATPAGMVSGILRVWIPGAESVVGTAYLDTTVPTAPVVTTANGHEISGLLTTKDHDGAVWLTYASRDGAMIEVRVPVGTAGSWSLATPDDAIESMVEVHVDDMSGNESEPVSVELDLTAPASAVVDIANKEEISGTAAEQGMVAVRYPSVSGKESFATTEVDARGRWILATPADAADGVLQVTMADPAGNLAQAVSATLDVTPAGAPVVETASTVGVAGRVDTAGEAETMVRVTKTMGTSICTTAVAEDGTWTCLIPDWVTDDIEVVAVSIDRAHNLSAEVSVLLDVTPPDKPNITVASVLGVSGVAEPGAVVRLTWPDGTSSLTTASSSGGEWSVVPPGVAGISGGQVAAQVLDDVGNASVTVLAALGPAREEPDPVESGLQLSAESIRVVVPACTGEVEVVPTGLTAQVEVLDTHGNPLPGAVVDFSAMGGLTPATNTAITDEQGVAEVGVLIDPEALAVGGEPSVHAAVTVGGQPIEVAGSPAVPATQVVHASAEVIPPQLTVVSRATEIPANGFATYNVLLEWIDGCGRAGVDAEVEFTVNGSAALSQTGATLDAYGQAWVQVTDVVAETVSLGARVDGEEVEPVELTFIPALPDPAQSTIQVDELLVPIPCEGAGTTRLTVMARDSGGHPLNGVGVRFEVLGDATTSQPLATTNETGQAWVDVVARGEGSAHITASLIDTAGHAPVILTGPGIDVTFAAECHLPKADPSSVWFAVSDGPKIADGSDAYAVTVFAKDANGGDVVGLASALTIIADDVLQVGEVSEPHPGEYQATVVSSQAGVFPVRATISLPDGSLREITGQQTTATFVSSWLPYMTTSVDTHLSPATGRSARASDGRDAFTITVSLRARLNGGALAPLMGQAGLLSVAVDGGVAGSTGPEDMGNESPPAPESTAGELAEVTAGVTTSVFTEVEPGIYTAQVTSRTAGTYNIVPTWRQAGGDPVRAEAFAADFVASPTDSLHPPTAVATGGRVVPPFAVIAVLLLGAGGALASMAWQRPLPRRPGSL